MESGHRSVLKDSSRLLKSCISGVLGLYIYENDENIHGMHKYEICYFKNICIFHHMILTIKSDK